MISRVELSLPLQEQLHTESLRAYPGECCGLLEGFVEDGHLRVVALHPMPNRATQPDRFEIDPAAHIALLRNLRGEAREIIGCYHSHPNGRAAPSDRDHESANEDGFLWLITVVHGETQVANTTAFVFDNRRFFALPIVHRLPWTAAVSRSRSSSLDRLGVRPI